MAAPDPSEPIEPKPSLVLAPKLLEDGALDFSARARYSFSAAVSPTTAARRAARSSIAHDMARGPPPSGPCRWSRSSSTRTSRGTGRRRRDRSASVARPRPCGLRARGRGRTAGRRSRCSGTTLDRPSRACCLGFEGDQRGRDPADEPVIALHRRIEAQALLDGLVVAAPLLAVPAGRDVRVHLPDLRRQHQPRPLAMVLAGRPRPVRSRR